ncbi:hypothetical protein [Acinetobacter sp. TGL-Y2]|uniref:hypothetical protein n=1 Tax=Acinetobacter sp. TGL-Y2 TaxID=1407071 RepID=UPI000A7CEDE4|nr:hypothetical protein [Acinetobacter sp. TGL-Y2]
MLVQTNTAKKASFNQFSTNATGNNSTNTDPNKKPVQDEKTPAKEQPDQNDKKDTKAK